MRRDEFDALPESNSPRLGWHKRPATKDVIETAAHLRNFNFVQLTDIVRALIESVKSPYVVSADQSLTGVISPDKFEEMVNGQDASSGYKIKTVDKKIRVYNTEIIRRLKSLYSNRCQICGCCCGEVYGSHLVHAHHIDYFSRSLNNDASNILIVCPNHHGIIHDTNPQFDKNNLVYHYPNGFVEGLKINYHL